MKTGSRWHKVGTEINRPHQGALVDTPDGDWWFVHFQDADVYGRIVHLQPVQWRDGWPLRVPAVSRCPATPRTRQAPKNRATTSDEFKSENQACNGRNANHEKAWCFAVARPGWLRSIPNPQYIATLHRQPNLLLQKFPARSFRTEALLEFFPRQCGEEAGLVVMGTAHFALAVQYDGINNRLGDAPRPAGRSR